MGYPLWEQGRMIRTTLKTVRLQLVHIYARVKWLQYGWRTPHNERRHDVVAISEIKRIEKHNLEVYRAGETGNLNAGYPSWSIGYCRKRYGYFGFRCLRDLPYARCTWEIFLSSAARNGLEPQEKSPIPIDFLPIPVWRRFDVIEWL